MPRTEKIVKEKISIIGNKKETISSIAREVKAIKKDDEDSIICPLCAEEYRISSSISNTENAESLYSLGWRYAASEAYGLEGYFCPACSREETPESKGEE